MSPSGLAWPSHIKSQARWGHRAPPQGSNRPSAIQVQPLTRPLAAFRSLAASHAYPLMKKIRLGIIGFGGMGQHHARNLLEGKIARCELVAACDGVAANLAKFP